MSDNRILIVEDESIVAEDISDSLRRLGYGKATIVDTGSKAVEISAEIHPSLILMDIKLKGAMDGIDAAREILKRRRVPVVYLSATGDPKNIERARLTEPFGYLLKPYNERELRTTIEMALFKHKMELRLRESERWHASTLRDIGDAVITTDARGRVSFLNSAAETLTGFTSAEALGKAFDEVLQLTDEKTGTRETPVTAVLKRGQAVHLTRTMMRRKKDGAVIAIDDSAAPIRDEAGNITGVVFVVRDITGREQIDENLRQAQKMQAVGTLAGGIAHDFNNLLTAILGYCHLILDSCEEPLLRERMRGIEDASKRAATLTQQLLTFSRKQVNRPEAFDLRTQVKDMYGLLLRLLGVDMDLKVQTGADPAIVYADRGKIGHMLLNLTANARDAILDGGLLTLKVENVTLTESHIGGSTIVPPGSYVLLSVTDTGCGMGESTLARIFEPFFTTKETGKGTGLGLSMVYGIVQESHGQICVESAPGAGSTFRIYFPQEQRLPAQASPAVFTVDDLAPHHETVLLVEDEPGLRKLIGVILSAEGYSILEAPDGVEALRVVKQHAGPIHLLLTDMIMPQMSGRQLAEKLLSLLPDIRVMLMSGNPAEMIEEEGDLDPRVQFLQKPFTPDALTEKLRAVLRRPRALKQSASGSSLQ